MTVARRIVPARWSMSHAARNVRSLRSMTDRGPADRRSLPSGLNVQISKLLVAGIVVATAATGALVVTLLSDLPGSAPPPPGPNGLPPPPPSNQPLVVFVLVTGIFVLSWLAVLVLFSRDQILLHLRQQQDSAAVPTSATMDVMLAKLRAELAGDRENELRALGERLAVLTAEYGEQRETDGYLRGMRMAATPDRPDVNVRSLRRTPPQR